MARTKISEFSATPANNTDIDSINIAEGCSPSGINDAIRELMAQLKDFQTGAVGDSFNGPVGTSTAAAGAFTTLSASGTTTLSGLTASTALALDASKNVVSVTNTGTGNNVLATSPTLVTPALGTPSALVGTNITGTATSFNINGTVGATTPTTGAFTTVAASGAVTLSGGTANGVAYLNGSKVVTSGSVLTFDGAILGVNGISVGRGAGAVSTNTAVGNSALAANTTGSQGAYFGWRSGYSNTTGDNNVAFGDSSLYLNTTGSANTAIGRASLYSNTTGLSNTALGYLALNSNTTASYNTAVGRNALYSNTTGTFNTAVGSYEGGGNAALAANTTGNYNTALGNGSLALNTTASNNTAVGYQAGYSNTTGAANTFIGRSTGNSVTTGSYNTMLGYAAGNVATTGSGNTFIGAGSAGSAGEAITTGAKNSILGAYTGNQGGLDIRTASNYIVLSDGDGNPRGIFDGSGNFMVGATSSSAKFLVAGNTNNLGVFTTSGFGSSCQVMIQSSNTANCNASLYFELPGLNGGGMYLDRASNSLRVWMANSTGGVSLAPNGTSWGSFSDERLKDIIEPIENATEKVSSLRAVIGRYKTDKPEKRRAFLIAQDVKAVLPEAVYQNSEEDDMLNLAYTDTIPLLVAAIKEQQAIIESLKARLDAANL